MIFLAPVRVDAAPARPSAALSVGPGAAASQPLRLDVEVSYKGFNGTADFVIEVAEGQLVEITFIWADTAVPDNAHRIFIKGYDLKTGLLTGANPRETLTFVANELGEFDIMCDWQCFGHEVLVARLGVGDGEAGSVTPALRPTHMTLALVGNGPESTTAMLTATVLDEHQDPVVDAPVVFEVEAELGGVSGLVEIGRARTDDQGMAALDHESRVTGDDARVQVRFAGVGVYAGSEAQITADFPAASATYHAESTSLRALAPWVRAGFALVVLAIWLTLAFVVLEVLRIGREPATPA